MTERPNISVYGVTDWSARRSGDAMTVEVAIRSGRQVTFAGVTFIGPCEGGLEMIKRNGETIELVMDEAA